MTKKTQRAIVSAAMPAADPALASFLRDLAREDVSPATLSGYAIDLQHFARWHQDQLGQPVRVAALTTMDLKSYKAHMVNVARHKGATVNRRLFALKRLCRWAIDEGLLKDDVTRAVKAVRLSKRQAPSGMERREIHALLRAAEQSPNGQARRNYALLQLILQTGIRLGEAAALKVGDLELHPKSGWLRVRYGKGGKERRLPVNASARAALRDYLDKRIHKPPDAPLFMSQRAGQGLTGHGIETIISETARRARLAKGLVSPHRLRHVFALTYIRDHPQALVRLAALLGHESLDTTAVYTQPSREDLAEDLENSSLNTFGS